MAYTITPDCIGCRLCVKVCPVEAIRGLVKKPHEIVAERCVDCGACGRVCPKEAVKDPLGKICRRIRFRSRWEKPQFDLEACVACRACVEVCPTSCLGQSPAGGSRDSVQKPLLENPRGCIACGFCVVECPVEAVKMVVPERK